jgi:hypothetical protein
MSEKVNWPIPLEQVRPMYQGQMGVPGSDTRLGLSRTCGNAVFYVDPNHGSASDNSDGTDPNAPLATIQAAHGKAVQGDTIAVMHNNSWQYGNTANGRILPVAEDVVITTPGLRIVGICPSGVNGVPWQPATDRGTCLTVKALDTLVEGFLFTAGTKTAPTAIRASWIGGVDYGDNLTVRNCVFESGINTAIQLEYVWYANIYQNRFWFNAYGLYANPLTSRCSNLDIHDNIFHECGKAMLLTRIDYSHIYRNDIFNHDARMGINATDDGICLINGLSNMVTDNTFSCLVARNNDLNTAGATDCWPFNHFLDAQNTANPT